MNFKKLFCGALTVALMGTMLMGCGGGSETTETTTAATTEATTVATTTTATTQAAAGEYKRGTVSGNVYTNEFLGIKYTAPANVKIAEQSETSQYEFMATNSSTGEVVFIMVQDLGNGISVTEDSFAGILKDQLKAQFTNPQFKELTTTKVAGIDFKDLTYSFTQSGIDMSQVMLLKSKGSKMAVINVTYRTESGRSTLLSGFSAL